MHELQVVEYVDLKYYLGKWHEIARFDSWFEKKNYNSVTAEYILMEDGSIKVVNSCCVDSNHNKRKTSIGRAKVVDSKSNAKLKVSFLPPALKFLDPLFDGDYWILKLASDYSVALIGEPSRKYLWILARTPNIDSAVYAEYVYAAEALGFDTSKLHKIS